MGKKPIDLTGMQIHSLKVIERAGTNISPNGTKEPLWKCICVCGNIVVVRGSMLRTGRQKSCGCYAAECAKTRLTKHGCADKERLYRIWSLMRDRCNNANSPHYALYGGRNITVCDEWNDYGTFRSWAIANGYSNKLSLDRIDSNGNYCPENCRWTTQKKQCNNKRNNHYLTYLGKTQTMSEWAEELGINYNTLRSRLNNYGWSVEDALSVRKAGN